MYKLNHKLHYVFIALFSVLSLLLYGYIHFNPIDIKYYSDFTLSFVLFLVSIECFSIYRFHSMTLKKPFSYMHFSLFIVLMCGINEFLIYLTFITLLKYYLKKELQTEHWILNALVMYFTNVFAGMVIYMFGTTFLDFQYFISINNFSVFAILVVLYIMIVSFPYTVVNKINNRLSAKDAQDLFFKLNLEASYMHLLYHYIMMASFIYIGMLGGLIISIILFLTEHHIQQSALIKLESITDALTNVYNRGYLDRTMQKYKMENRWFCIIMLDIDNFKHINETYNHLVGDQVLLQFAQVIRNSLRDNDIIARYGGEEFAVILENVTPENAIMVAERIRKNIEKKVYICHYNSDVYEIKHTSSLGMALYNTKHPNNVLEEADNNLKVAKHTGKNKLYYHDTDILEKVLSELNLK